MTNKPHDTRDAIILYLILFIVPTIIMFVFNISFDVYVCIIVSLVITGFVLFGIVYILDSYDVGCSCFGFVAVTIVVFAITFALVWHFTDSTFFEEDDRKSGSSPSTTASARSPEALKQYYKATYPMTWGYITKNSTSPNTYVITYNSIWGDLQRYHGDGIVFRTLTAYEQSLVNYPSIGLSVYFASSTSTTYHSIPYCYTLLGSDIISRSAEYRYRYDPCSKCVGQ